MVFYTENSKVSTNKLLELIHSVSLQNSRQIYKNQLYFYTLVINKPQMKCKLHVQQHQKEQILRNQFNKGSVTLYTKTYKTLLKEPKKALSK